MALSRIPCLLTSPRAAIINYSSSRFISALRWRVQNGLERDPKQFSPLTQYPDYSFVDGRPRPLGFRERCRREFQEKCCQKIVELSHELDVAVQLYEDRLANEAEAKKEILKSKLKPKGAALLKCKNKVDP